MHQRKLTLPETSPFVREFLFPPLLPINASHVICSLELPSVCCMGRCRSQESLSKADWVSSVTQLDSVLERIDVICVLAFAVYRVYSVRVQSFLQQLRLERSRVPQDGVSASVGPRVGPWSPKIMMELNFLQEMERQVTREEFLFSERSNRCGTRRPIPSHSRHLGSG